MFRQVKSLRIAVFKMFLSILLKVNQSETLNIYSFLKKGENNRKFSLWTKSIIFGIIIVGIQKWISN